jgi:hypothetical protein
MFVSVASRYIMPVVGKFVQGGSPEHDILDGYVAQNVALFESSAGPAALQMANFTARRVDLLDGMD